MNTKQCSKCKTTKPTKQFNWLKTRNRLRATCKQCHSQESANWQKQNRQKINKQKKIRIKSKQEWINKLKSKPCKDCKQTFPPECMDFDHTTNNKHNSISKLVTNNSSNKLIKKEIEKCDLICSNCHRIRTKNRGWNKTNTTRNQN